MMMNMSNAKFYTLVTIVIVLTFGAVSEKLHPEIAAQREAIRRAETAQEAAKVAKSEADEREYQARKAQTWANCVEHGRCGDGGEPERAVMRDQLLRDAYSRR
jgi:hypothetical protein